MFTTDVRLFVCFVFWFLNVGTYTEGLLFFHVCVRFCPVYYWESTGFVLRMFWVRNVQKRLWILISFLTTKGNGWSSFFWNRAHMFLKSEITCSSSTLRSLIFSFSFVQMMQVFKTEFNKSYLLFSFKWHIFSKQILPSQRSEASLLANISQKWKIQNKKDPSRSCRVGLNPILIYDGEQRMIPSYYLLSNTGTEYSGKSPLHPLKVNKRIQRIV